MVGDSIPNFNMNVKGNCLARALYDNIAESPDELAFRRGDILTVLEQNTAGLEGWWLCSLKGRQGICPGNRLRIIPGCYDTGAGITSTLTHSRLSSTGSTTPTSNSTASSPRFSSGAQTLTSPIRPISTKVVTPKRVGDVFTYDSPRNPLPMEYDIPPSRNSISDNISEGSRLSRSSSLRYDTPRTFSRGSLEQYDTPRVTREICEELQNMPPHYDSPRIFYDTPRPSSSEPPAITKTLIKGLRGGPPSTKIANNEPQGQEYDVPRPSLTHIEIEPAEVAPSDRSSGVSIMSCDSQLSASSSASSLQASESLSLSSLGGSSNRSSIESHDVYDVPPEPRRISQQKQDLRPKLPPRENKTDKNQMNAGETYDTPPTRNLKKTDVVYDVPPQVSRDARPSDFLDNKQNRISSGSDSSLVEFDLSAWEELPLELDSARDTLMKQEQEVYRSVEKLTAIYSAHANFDKSNEDVKVVVYRLNECNQEFLKFTRGAVGNAIRNGEGKLAKRLSRLFDPILKASSILDDTWQLMKLDHWNTKENSKDTLQQLSTVALTLAEDVKHISSVIKGHSHLIFKRSQLIEVGGKLPEDEEKTPVQERPLPDLPSKGTIENMYQNEACEWLEDYDYVNLESKELIEKEQNAIKESLPSTLRKSYDNLIKQSHLTVDSDHKRMLQKKDTDTTNNHQNNSTPHLDINDKQVLHFYGVQAELHLQHLNTAIDAFLHTIENNQPPKVFIAHSKFVILSAHKLVYIGDTVHRNIINKDIRTCVLNSSNTLCDAMKNTVTAAKTAALQFPSVTAVQAMVDAFVSISYLANNLKKSIHRLPV